ncbi:hypothetical protein AB0K49_25340 [Streptomyces decoyicus]
MTFGLHVSDLGDDDPLPLLAVAQFHTREVPDLAGPDSFDMLQVF